MSIGYRVLAQLWQRLPGRMRRRLHPLYLDIRHSLQRIQAQRVPIDQLLMGDQSGVEAALLAEGLEDRKSVV